MVGDDNPYVLVFEFGNDVLNVLHRNRVDSGERLIKQDELRIDSKGPCNLTTTSLTSGELVTITLAHFVQVKLVKQVLKALLALCLCEVRGHLHHGHDVVLH